MLRFEVESVFGWVVFPNGKESHSLFVRRGLIQGGWFYEKSSEKGRFNQATLSSPPKNGSSIWGFPKMVVPPKHPKMIIFSRKTHGYWGTHHFRKPPYTVRFFFP